MIAVDVAIGNRLLCNARCVRATCLPTNFRRVDFNLGKQVCIMTCYLRGSMAATDRWPNNIALCKWDGATSHLQPEQLHDTVNKITVALNRKGQSDLQICVLRHFRIEKE